MTLRSISLSSLAAFLFSLGAFHPSHAASPDTVRSLSTVTEATVFQEGASLQAEVQVKLRAGKSFLRVGRLPLNLKAETIRIFPGPGLKAGAPRKPAQSRIDTAASPQWQKLQQRLQQLQNQQSRLHSKKKGVEAQKSILEANRKLKGSAVNAQELRAMLQLQGQEATRLSEEEAQLNQKLSHLQSEIKRLRRKKSDLLRSITQRSGEILLPVQVQQNGSYKLKLHYAFPSASWRSTYAVRAMASRKELHLHHRAIVSQSSGTDWKNIRLSLALGSARDPQQKPELNPQYIDFPPRQKQRYSARSNAKIQQVEAAHSPSNMQDSPPKALGSTQQQNLSYRSFTLDQPVTVRQGRPSEAFHLKQLTRPSDYHYQAIPKLQPGAYLLARLSIPDSLSMPRGPMNLYQEDTYVGEYRWEASMAKDTQYLPLGRDAEVPVERKLVRRYTETKAFSSKQTTHYHYRLSATNRRQESIELQLRDQIPLSRHESISIRHELPADAQYDSETGEVNFHLAIPPGASLKRSIRFSITYPEDRVPRLPR